MVQETSTGLDPSCVSVGSSRKCVSVNANERAVTGVLSAAVHCITGENDEAEVGVNVDSMETWNSREILISEVHLVANTLFGTDLKQQRRGEELLLYGCNGSLRIC